MSIFIQTLSKKKRIDEPQFWAEKDVYSQPREVDLKAFQKQINDICGTTRDGKEIVRVKWAWDPECFSVFYTEWDAAGSPIKSDLRAKYLYKSIEIDSRTVIDISPPRFVLEERIEPEQYLEAWEMNRWQYDAKLCRDVVVRPGAPRDGYYTLLRRIEAHDPGFKCCERALAADQECFGVYRPPAPIDLDWLRMLTKQIEQNGRPNPYKPLSSEVFAQIQAETDSREKARYEQKMNGKDEKRRIYTDFLKPHAEFSKNIETGAAQSIIIPGETASRSESGLIIPQ